MNKNRPKFLHPIVIITVAAGILLAVTYWPRGGSTTNPNPPAPTAANTNITPVVPPPPAAGLKSLAGRWLRPDGGYILDIRKVDDNGQLDAAYLNPNPIRVTSASAKSDGGAMKIYVELNDVNYPGCKYNLTYIPDKDILVGTYFQAALGETYDVGFEREK